MSLRPITLILCATLLAARTVSAEVFIPLLDDTSLTLGSGVNLMKPGEGLPSCFDFKQELLDTGVGSFKYSIDAVSSIEEVNKIRRKSAAVSGSYGTTSAKLSAWENTTSSDKLASLYVVIEARIVGPRMAAVNIVPKPSRATLLNTGDAAAIIKQCGTHVATTEHRGQTLRVVVDLREADQATKQEIEARFSAKTKMGLFKAKASASYSSSIEKLATDKKVKVVVEGRGTPPAPEAIVALLKTKAGDLESVAQALAPIMAGLGTSTSYVGYGLTLQPIQLLAPVAFDITNDDLSALEALADVQYTLNLEKGYLTKESDIDGLDEATAKQLGEKVSKVDKLLAELKIDANKCLFSKDANEKTCPDQADAWKIKLRKSRDIRAELKVDGGGIVLATDVPFAGRATLVAVINNNEIALDTLPLYRGKQTNLLVRKSTSPPPTPGYPGPVPDQGPPVTRVSSALPLTLNIALLSAILPEVGLGPLDNIFVGCFGGTARSSDGPYAQFRVALDQAFLHPDSICKVPLAPIMIPSVGHGSNPGYFPGLFGTMLTPPIDLMPLQYDPLKLGPITQPVQLRLKLTDMVGLETVHLLSADLRKTFGDLQNSLEQ